MENLFRADFDFKAEAYGIKRCSGYVICKDVQMQENGGYTFGVHSVIIKKLIANKPDFDKINAMAINHCKLFDDVIKVGSLADYHD